MGNVLSCWIIKGKREKAKQCLGVHDNLFGSSLSDPLHNMPSAQDPFYVVKAEIQESVSSSSFFSNYLGFAFCLIQIRNFNFSLNNSYGVLKMLQIWVNDGYRVFFFKF